MGLRQGGHKMVGANNSSLNTGKFYLRPWRLLATQGCGYYRITSYLATVS
jgi:hypothetical protein